MCKLDKNVNNLIEAFFSFHIFFLGVLTLRIGQSYVKDFFFARNHMFKMFIDITAENKRCLRHHLL